MTTKFSQIVAAGAISGTDTVMGLQSGPTDVVYLMSDIKTFVGASYLPLAGGTLTGGIGFSTTNTLDIGTSATVLAPRTVYAGTSFVGPLGTFTTAVGIGGATVGSYALAVQGPSLHKVASDGKAIIVNNADGWTIPTLFGGGSTSTPWMAVASNTNAAGTDLIIASFNPSGTPYSAGITTLIASGTPASPGNTYAGSAGYWGTYGYVAGAINQFRNFTTMEMGIENANPTALSGITGRIQLGAVQGSTGNRVGLTAAWDSIRVTNNLPLYLYNVGQAQTDQVPPTNYERLVADFGLTTVNIATIATAAGGTGTVRPLRLNGGLQIQAAESRVYGNLNFVSDTSFTTIKYRQSYGNTNGFIYLDNNSSNIIVFGAAGAGVFQHGDGDAAVAVAQTVRVQSVIAGTAAANGANWTLIGSLPTGTGTSGDIIFQTGVKTGSGTTQGTATTALTIKGETQALVTSALDAASSAAGALQVAGGASVAKRFWLPAITASAGLQTAVLCQSSGGEVIADSVACLASSEAFKENIQPSDMGLATAMALQPITYRYKATGNDRFDNAPNQRAIHAGIGAQQAATVDIRLVAYDRDGSVRTIRQESVIAVLLKAVQELKVDNDDLRSRIAA